MCGCTGEKGRERGQDRSKKGTIISPLFRHPQSSECKGGRKGSAVADLPVRFVLLLLGLLFLRCAGQIPPSGGPQDTAPPRIIRTFPDSSAVRVHPGRIELEFNEYVDRQSVEESIFISPHIGELEFEWSGPEVAITFSEALRDGLTYVVTVGTDVIDVRAGNRMGSAFSLAFSTGDSIDRGRIGGRVFDEDPEGLLIFAYRLDTRAADSLDPTRLKPDYVTQTGNRGTFTLANIAYGLYRVFSIRDEYRNLLYDRDIDQYGVATFDPLVHGGAQPLARLWFRLTQEDTTRPFLSSVTAGDRSNVQMQFSESIDSGSFNNASVSIEDTVRQESLAIQTFYLDRRDRSRVGVVLATPTRKGTEYKVTVRGVFDGAGNPLDTSNASYTFVGADAPDTTRPVPQLLGIPDSTRGVPMEQIFELDFSEPVVQGAVTSAVALEDTEGVRRTVALHWLSARSLQIVPVEALREKEWYVLRVVLDSIGDYQMNTYSDSVFSVRFETLDLRTTASVSGVVSDALRSDRQVPVYVSASRLEDFEGLPVSVRVDSLGPFRFARLVEGRYAIDAFIDADSSGTYSYGLPFPFAPSERFTVYSDTLRVRARWPLEGLLLQFK